MLPSGMRRGFAVPALLLYALLPPLGASPAAATITITASPEDAATSFPAPIRTLPDEHTTFFTASGPPYLVFAAADYTGVTTGAMALETQDLVNFTLAPGYGASPQGYRVIWSSSAFTKCDFSGAPVFDQNYAAPGSVVQDPTLAPGNLIMIYEAEKHCPLGAYGGFSFPFWASVGLARSSDGGKTWPQPGSYGTSRYAAVQAPGDEVLGSTHPAWGDAIPSAFVDDVNTSSGTFLYVTYAYEGDTSTLHGDGLERVARAQLGGADPLQFYKWYVDTATHVGGWTQPGLHGADTGMTRAKGCALPAYQGASSISYIDPLRLYLLTFVCVEQPYDAQQQRYVRSQATWYFATATSLASQNWSPPQPVGNTTFAVTVDTTAGTPDNWLYDGWYPSFMSPGRATGHLGLTGTAFFLSGSPVSYNRNFVSRGFVIGVSTPAGPGGATLTLNAPEGRASLSIPPGAMQYSVGVTLQPPLRALPPAVSNAGSLTPTGVAVEVVVSPELEPTSPVTVAVGYKLSDLSGPEDQVVLARYDAGSGAWIPLPSTVDKVNHSVSAASSHLSLFEVMTSAPASTLLGGKVFPNPFRPNQGQTSVVFANLPAGATLSFFNLLGERFRTLTVPASGLASWDGKNDGGQNVASGLYLVIADDGAGNRKVFKVAVER